MRQSPWRRVPELHVTHHYDARCVFINLTKIEDPVGEADRLAALFTTRAGEATLPHAVRTAHDRMAPTYRNRVDDATTTDAETDTPFTEDELGQALHLTRTTSPGDDDFGYEFYTRSPAAFRRVFLQLCNASWTARKLPAAWKRALIVPIPKPGGAGHRPISLLHCAGKIMERMVAARLRWVTPSVPQMYGFVPGRSTSDAIAQVVADISGRRRLNNKGKVVAVFLDLDKAFERAAPLPVLDSLRRLGVRGAMLGWIGDYLSSRSARVRVQGHLSSLHQVTTGVPQGSVVSPLLFNAVVATILTEASPSTGTSVVAYADDIAVVAAGRHPFQAVQRTLDAIYSATSRAGLLVSPAKTKAMYFHGKTVAGPSPITLAGHPLEYVAKYKYLGVVIDRNLSCVPHVAHLRQKLTRRINLMRLLGGTIDGATTTMMLHLYKALVHSCLTYGAPALMMAKASAVESIERLQRVALRVALGLPRTSSNALTVEEAGVLPLRLAIQDATTKFVIRAALHPEPFPCIDAVRRDLPKERKIFGVASWALRAGSALLSRGCPLPEPSIRAAWAPWHPLPVRAHIDNPVRKTVDPAAASASALRRIAVYEEAGAWPLYTDASRLPDGPTTWAVTSASHDTSGRLADHTPITLAEITAVREALRSFEDTPTDAPSVVVHTDSMAAVQILTSRRPRSYHQTVQATWDCASRLGRPVVLHWVPSHTGIPGNDRADALAAAATTLQEIQPTEVSLGALRPRIDSTGKTLTRHYIDQRLKTPLSCWYQQTTPDGHQRPPLRRRYDRQLRQLRTWCFGRRPWTCRTCDEDQSPVHYLTQCPGRPTLRHRLLDYLRPDEHRLPDRERAALILRRAADRPETLVRLLEADPFGATWPGART